MDMEQLELPFPKPITDDKSKDAGPNTVCIPKEPNHE